MRGGVRCAGDHAVGLTLVHHHGCEVGDVLHGLAGLLEGNALLLAQLGEVGGEFFGQLGVAVVDDVGLAKLKAQGGRTAFDIFLGAQDSQLGDLIAQQHMRCFEDAVIVAFGQDDVCASSTSLVEQLLLEDLSAHDWLNSTGGLDGRGGIGKLGKSTGHGHAEGFCVLYGQLGGALRGARNKHQGQAQCGRS